jgi:hypothetical protein
VARKALISEVEVGITKLGDRAVAELRVDPGMKVADVSKVLSRITANKELMQRIGLKGCTACKSGLDFIIRTRFDHVIKVSL